MTSNPISSPAEAVWTILIVATILAYLAKLVKQPLIPAFIVAGIILGPLGFRVINEPETIKSLAELTIVFVMFTAGLEMDLGRMKSLGRVVTFGGTVQFLSVGLLGFLIAWPFVGWPAACYLGILFAFASTALSINLMTDKKELDTLHGGISLGILLLQDIIAIVILSVLPAKDLSVVTLLKLVVESVGLVSIGILLGYHVVPTLLARVSSSPQLLCLISLSLGAAFAKIAMALGLSGSLGAFITGVALTNAPYELGIEARVKSLRDFFLPIFFAALGIQLAIPSLGMFWMVLALTIGGLILKPLIIATLTAKFGYQRRTCWSVGYLLTPMSEFGLVIVAAGIKLGHIGNEMMSVSIAIVVVSMIASVYLSLDKLSTWLLPRLGYLDKIGPLNKVEEELHEGGRVYDAVLIGCHRAGRYILDNLQEKGLSVLVMELDYQHAKTLEERGTDCILGDAGLQETWEHIENMDRVKLIISTISDPLQSKRILDFLKENWPSAKVILSADHTGDTHALAHAGADYVFCAHNMAGKAISSGQYDDVLHGDAKPHLDQLILDLDELMNNWHITSCPLPKNGNARICPKGA